ncbi:MlaD family protein [Mucilaginibacter xinganensis]|uniref:Mce related protein n=1 Tax=Mucilaginibacter xinganensis TaxID=1234841 RepID=A0A223NYX2_9SPHI|nr:MlaD family protein [Mucilaginibacter xinganensis]ASU34771.1 mce related protein [Mucilaginibacter xinganensis]
MAKQGENNIKLGTFVLTGLIALIFAFYMIGKNRNMFGSNFELKTNFSNLNGLIEGNNVLFAGIQAGTVKKITIVSDSSIEVLMLIDNKVKPFIHKNAIASIGTEGLMGDKVINISPSKVSAPFVDEGDQLAHREVVNTDEMLQTLSKTNTNIASISEALKGTVLSINNSKILALFNDEELERNIRSTLKNISKASANANELTGGLNDLISQTKHGKGAAGVLLSDTGFAANLNTAMVKIKSASDNANNFTLQLNSMLKGVKGDLEGGKGTLHFLLKDSTLAKNLSKSMDNVQKGTDAFAQDMEALKHNFLLRGYFKNLEKQRLKEKNKNNVPATTTNPGQ